MTDNRVFLEKYKLIEMVALMFNVNKRKVRQNERKSLNAMNKGMSYDYRRLIRIIAFFICRDDTKIFDSFNSKECAALIETLSNHGRRYLSLYDFVTKHKIGGSTAPHVINMAILDFFILPYLMRVVSELKDTFKGNKILSYLGSYIEFLFVETSSSAPLLNVFLKQHKALVPRDIEVDKTRYRTDEYQTWDNFVEEQSDYMELLPGNIQRAEMFGWHCAGKIVYQLLKFSGAANSKQAPRGGNKATVSLLKKDYDFIYKSFLSINLDTKVDAHFENCREYRYKEIGNIINAFEKAINSNAEQDDHSDDTSNLSGDESTAEIDGFNVFCDAVLNTVPTTDKIKKKEDELREFLKYGHGSRYTSFFAWCIFIAKCKHDNIKEGEIIQYCELKIAEHQKDYINWNVGSAKSKLKNRATYADFKNDMLCRLGYIRIYNKLVSGHFEKTRPRPIDKFLIKDWRTINGFPSTNPPMLSFLNEEKYTGEIIHPFTVLESYIDSWLKWDNCFSVKVNIDEARIKKSKKKFDGSLSWLVIPNVRKQEKSNAKMKLCIACAVRLYPELMGLAGLVPIQKYTHLKHRELERLMHLLKSCQCEKINKMKLTKNHEAGEWSHFYHAKPICI